MAQRILGMGDIVGLVNEAQTKFDAGGNRQAPGEDGEGRSSRSKISWRRWARSKSSGPMGKVMGMIPGMSEMTKQMNMDEGDVEKQMGRMRAIYDSMNQKEREEARPARWRPPPPHRPRGGRAS